MTQVTKAIISVAGWGTRRLPITKSIEKCMMPVGNRPIVDYIVRDCIKAGVTDIYFVVNQGSRQIYDYYTDNQRLNEFLEYNGKQDLMELAHPPQNVNFHYVEQDPNAKYGTAVPIALVYPQIKKGESVLYIYGDGFIHNTDGSSEAMKLIAVTPEGGSTVMSTEIPIEEVGRFGVIAFNEENGSFAGIVEKPSVEQAPSNQINLGNYVLNYDLLGRIANYCQIEISGEYMITDPISQYVLDNGIIGVYKAGGEFLDCGNVHGWLHANQLIVNHQ